MAFARDIMRATLRARREQERRNREALEAEQQAQEEAGLVEPPKRRRGRPPKMRRPEYEDKMLAAPGGDKGETADPLEGVPWASPIARVRAYGYKLTAADFAGQECSGKAGFTVADVERIGG